MVVFVAQTTGTHSSHRFIVNIKLYTSKRVFTNDTYHLGHRFVFNYYNVDFQVSTAQKLGIRQICDFVLR